LRGVDDVLTARREHVVAVSPIIAGAALKGPADRLMTELGHEPSVVGVAELYAPVCGTLVIDQLDAHLADAVRSRGMRCIVTDTIMRSPDVACALARTTIGDLQ
jgi:LPPG:FO 2-phospho-L-lactate transferase